MERALVILGLVAAVAAAVVALAGRGPDDVGTVVREPAPTAPSTELADVSRPASPTPRADAPVQVVPTTSARLADQPRSSVVPPARIVAPTIGVDAAVVEVGVDPDGLMTVPGDVATAGWYRHGPVPGAPGSAVIAGHVDSRTQGRGAFFELGALALGDEIVVVDADGQETTWTVTARETFAKASLPVADLYDRSGSPRLVLITCGGDFDAAARSYRSNVVVVAQPAS